MIIKGYFRRLAHSMVDVFCMKTERDNATLLFNQKPMIDGVPVAGHNP